MKDPQFIGEMLTRGNDATTRVRTELDSLSLAQLNWKKEPATWSIAQCLDHLVTSNSLYFPILRKIAEGKHRMNLWEKWSPFSTFFGKMLEQQLQETVRKKIKSPGIFMPATGPIDPGIIERFYKHQDTLLGYVGKCRDIDLDKIQITSPIAAMVTYSLRSTIRILIQHQHRHINQAVKIKASAGFTAE